MSDRETGRKLTLKPCITFLSEGIPIAQQHLIWNNLELDDEYSLHDYK